MHKPYTLFSSSIVLLIAMSNAYAESNTGTGTPTIRVAVTEDQRVLVQVSEPQSSVVGSAELQQGYSDLTLDAYNHQGPAQANWGRAEVLMGCGTADVLVYQAVDGQEVEVYAQQVDINACYQ